MWLKWTMVSVCVPTVGFYKETNDCSFPFVLFPLVAGLTALIMFGFNSLLCLRANQFWPTWMSSVGGLFWRTPWLWITIFDHPKIQAEVLEGMDWRRKLHDKWTYGMIACGPLLNNEWGREYQELALTLLKEERENLGNSFVLTGTQ